LIIEVLSPTTARNDRGDKRLAYASLETLKEYVLVSQDQVRVELIRPTGIAHPVLESTQDTLMLESIACSIGLSEIYA